MSDTPLVDECRRTNALGIFELAEKLELENTRLKLEVFATDTAKDLLIRVLFNSLHQIRPYYAEQVAKEKRSIYNKVHEVNLKQSREALNAFDEYEEMKNG